MNDYQKKLVAMLAVCLQYANSDDICNGKAPNCIDDDTTAWLACIAEVKACVSMLRDQQRIADMNTYAPLVSSALVALCAGWLEAHNDYKTYNDTLYATLRSGLIAHDTAHGEHTCNCIWWQCQAIELAAQLPV